MSWFITAVWPNLVASMIWGIPAGIGFIAHHLHVRRGINALHRRIDELASPKPITLTRHLDPTAAAAILTRHE